MPSGITGCQLSRSSSTVDGPFTREGLLAAFCTTFGRDYSVFDAQGFSPFLDDYLAHWLHRSHFDAWDHLIHLAMQ